MVVRSAAIVWGNLKQCKPAKQIVLEALIHMVWPFFMDERQP